LKLSVQPLLDPNASQTGDGFPTVETANGFSPFDPSVAAADPMAMACPISEFLDGTNPRTALLLSTCGNHLGKARMPVTWSTRGGMTNAVESTPTPPATGQY